MTFEEVCTAGDFLRYYYADLRYISNFQSFLKDETNSHEFLAPGLGSFYNFLVEFKIIRNIEKGSALDLLRLTKNWCEMSVADDVDAFAQRLKQRSFSRNAILSSLASKVLFLNNPWKILPMDALGRKALLQRGNLYSDYLPRVSAFAKQNSSIIEEHLDNLNSYCEKVEEEFKNKLPQIKTIRKNRFIDKLLWVQGLNSRTGFSRSRE
ncbi:MAG: hypothetical protein ACHQNE_00075 [Candidatus Kapaibacterium sp.]